MNKLEKILAQSVTPEMVAEQLTEQEIEEVIEEYELKIESSKEFFDTAEQRAAEYEQKAILCQRFANDWKKTANEEKEKIKTWRSVVEKAKQALTKCTKSNENKPTQNEQRAKLIEQAKQYIRDNGKGMNLRVDKKHRTVTIDNGELWYYPSQLVWNKHIAKALTVAFHNVDTDYIYKFGSNAPQPTEIVEGMDVELSGVSGKFYASGRAISYCEELDAVTFSSIYETGENVHIYSGERITGVRTDGFKITGDTKAKYSDSDE